MLMEHFQNKITLKKATQIIEAVKELCSVHCWWRNKMAKPLWKTLEPCLKTQQHGPAGFASVSLAKRISNRTILGLTAAVHTVGPYLASRQQCTQ